METKTSKKKEEEKWTTIKSPPFHEPAQAISQSPIEPDTTTWEEEFDNKFGDGDIADMDYSLEDIKSFIQQQIEIAKKEGRISYQRELRYAMKKNI